MTIFIISIYRLKGQQETKIIFKHHTELTSPLSLNVKYKYMNILSIQDIQSKDSGSLNVEDNFNVKIFN